MKHMIVVVLMALVGAQSSNASTPQRASATATDAQWAEVEQMFQSTEAPPPRDQKVELRLWGARYYLSLYDAALKFYEEFPDDPRRWKGVVQMHNKANWITNEPASEEERHALSALVSESCREKMSRKVWELVRTGLKAADTRDEERAYFDYTLNFSPAREAASAAIKRGETPDLGALRAELTRLARGYPDDEMLPIYTDQFVRLRQQMGATTQQTTNEWRRWSNSENRHIQSFAEEQLRTIELLAKPLELSFVALDGRKVDLASLRDKVVLIDFWATWCGPCIDELPNVKEVYKKYQEEGFEVIGVSVDRAADRKRLIEFIAANEVPWPQYFDGKYWESELIDRFAIRSLPAMLLLDRNGVVASASVLRGKALEEAVRRLLAQPSG